MAPDLNDGVDSVDGADDAVDEAAADRSELFRAISLPSLFFFCKYRHLTVYLCNFLFLF